MSMKSKVFKFVFLATAIIMASSAPLFAEEKIDASDPTKIYTYAGGGMKYTDYSNGDEMLEMRATGNIGLSKSDMVMFEIGYGWHSGDSAAGDDSDITNARFRYFHLFPMDYSVVSGYRGLAAQADLQLAGRLKGTDGQNTLVLGVLPAFGINEKLSLYVAVNLVNTWDRDFDRWNGAGVGAAPLLVYTPDNWWSGAYVQLWPNYTRFLSGELEGEGSGNVDVTTGGEITSKTLWSATFQKNLDKDLKTFRRGRDTGLKNDWNVFFNITTYF